MSVSLHHTSPNCNDRLQGQVVDILLLHYTGMVSAEAALARLCDPAAKVSAHYLIDEGGSCYRLVDESLRAWHAGESLWTGRPDVNSRSIGIELVNPGHEFGYRPFPEAQMAALETLAHGILARHPIPPHQVLGHSDVAPLRKQDPGELFDWCRLACAGIGVWPHPVPGAPEEIPVLPSLAPDDRGGEVGALQGAFAAFGYGIERSEVYDALTEAVVTAFQRHFRQERVDGIADRETRTRLHRLLAALPISRRLDPA